MSDHTPNKQRYKMCGNGDNCLHPDGPYLPLSEYYKGSIWLCKPCARQYRKEHHERNREHDNQRSIDYIKKNKERVYARQREWKEENRDSINKRLREKYLRDENYRKERQQMPGRWRKRHPHRARALDQRNRARRLSVEGEVTSDDILTIYKRQGGRCYWCQKNVGDNYHVDHRIPLARGGKNTPANIVISCPQCNQSKSDKLPHEWCGRLL